MRIVSKAPQHGGAEPTTEPPTEPVSKPSVEIANDTPGSAVIYKGEPSATELGMLRFDFTAEDLTRISSIVGAAVKRYEELEQQGKNVTNEYINSMVEVMKNCNLAAPLSLEHSSQVDDSSSETQGEHTVKHTSKFVNLLRRFDLR
jgi:hypothetical protein